MTKKDYELIAGALNAALWEATDDEFEWGRRAVIRCAERIAQRLHDDNPLFNERTFMAAVKA